MELAIIIFIVFALVVFLGFSALKRKKDMDKTGNDGTRPES
jgi:hypothetical protein